MGTKRFEASALYPVMPSAASGYSVTQFRGAGSGGEVTVGTGPAVGFEVTTGTGPAVGFEVDSATGAGGTGGALVVAAGDLLLWISS